LSAPSQYTVNETTGQVTLATAPASGAAVVVENFESACYGIVADRVSGAGPSAIEEVSSGLAINQIHGIYLDTATLGFFYNVRTDTNTYSGLYSVGSTEIAFRECEFLFAAFPVVLGSGNDQINLGFKGTVRGDSTELQATPDKRNLTIAATNTNIIVTQWLGAKSSNIAPAADVQFDCGRIIHARSASNVAAGSTVFLAETGANATQSATEFRAPSNGFIVGLHCFTNTAPGAGQSYDYNVRLNATDTALAASISGAGVFEAIGYAGGAIAVTRGQRISIRLVTSATAAGAIHQVALLWMTR
jgi:hypothetical protein